MNAVRFLQKENFINILEHNFVVVCFSVEFGKVTVKVQTVLSARYHHRQVLDASDNSSRKLSNISFFMQFFVKKLSWSHIFITIQFLIALSYILLLFLLLFFVILVQLIVWNMESHFTKNVSFGLPTLVNQNNLLLTLRPQRIQWQLRFSRWHY